MKIALASARIIDRDVPHNMAQMKHWMQEAAAAGAELSQVGLFHSLHLRFSRDCTVKNRNIAITDRK